MQSKYSEGTRIVKGKLQSFSSFRVCKSFTDAFVVSLMLYLINDTSNSNFFPFIAFNHSEYEEIKVAEGKKCDLCDGFNFSSI